MMQAKKRILFVSPQSGVWGASLSMLAVIKHLVNKNYSVVVLLKGDKGIVEHLEKLNVQVEMYRFKNWCDVPSIYKRWHLLKSIKDIYGVNEQAQYLREKYGDFDYVYTNTIVTYYGLMLARCLKAKHIHHIRENAIKDFDMSFGLGYKATVGVINRFSEAIICVSKDVERQILKHVPRAKTTVVYNGVADIGQQAKLDMGSGQLKLVLVARLSEEKGVLFAVKSAVKLYMAGMNISLDIYGSGVLYDKIAQVIKEKGAEGYIHLMGYVPNVPLHEYHVGLMCSKHEAFGRTTVEYMMHGLPVIGTGAGGTKEIVVDGKTGLLFKGNDMVDFCCCVQTLYDNRHLIKKYGEDGYMRAKVVFSVDRYVMEVERVIELLDNN